MTTGTTQSTLVRFDPPDVNPVKAIPGGWHHIPLFGYDFLAGFIPLDPAECESCQNRVYTDLGCVNGHKRLGMTDGSRAFCSGVGSSGRETSQTAVGQ